MQNRNIRWAVGIALLTVVITVAWLTPVLKKYDGDALTLVGIGTKFSEGLEPGDEGYTVGYDGQFAYYMILHGFDAPDYYEFDATTYRYQRILYPALVWVLSLGGSVGLVPWVMLIVNIIAHSVGAGLLAYLLARLGGRPSYALYALVYSLWAGEIVAIHLDLNEPLAMALGLAGLVCYHHERVRWAALCFALAALTKDFGLVIMAGAALQAWFAGRRRDFFLLGFGSVIPYVAWMLALRVLMGQSVLTEKIPRLSLIPFVGLREVLGLAEGEPLGFVLLLMILAWLVVPAVLWSVSAARTLRQGRNSWTAWLLICCALFVVYLPPDTFKDLAATLRVGEAVVAAILLYGVQRYPRRLPFMVIIWIPTLITVIFLPGFLPG